MTQTPAEKIETRILHLGDVNLWPLCSGYHHSFEVVIFREWFLRQWSSLISGVVEDSVHLVLECLSQWVTGCGLQLIVVCFLNNLEHVSLIIARENHKAISPNIQGHYSYPTLIYLCFKTYEANINVLRTYMCIWHCFSKLNKIFVSSAC